MFVCGYRDGSLGQPAFLCGIRRTGQSLVLHFLYTFIDLYLSLRFCYDSELFLAAKIWFYNSECSFVNKTHSHWSFNHLFSKKHILIQENEVNKQTNGTKQLEIISFHISFMNLSTYHELDITVNSLHTRVYYHLGEQSQRDYFGYSFTMTFKL